jgi:hypothetical protein
MDGIVASLRLGFDALLLKEDAYEEMKAAANPVVKGLVLIVVVGVVIALCAFVGDVLEWASIPDLHEIKDTVYYYMTQMPWWAEVFAQDPIARDMFETWYDFGWQIAFMFQPSIGGAAAGIIMTPLGLVVRWLIYGLLAYLFARWLGGTGDLSETLGVLALAVAPQALAVLTLIPFVQMGNLVAVWAILCAYVGIKTAHKLPWHRAVWATLLPFILVIAAMFLASCLGVAVFAAMVKGA